MTSTSEKPRPRRPQRFALPDRLPGEDEYGVFINHLTGCADCGYGQVKCPRATELWQAYKEKKRAKQH
jgi:ribosomal protein L37E